MYAIDQVFSYYGVATSGIKLYLLGGLLKYFAFVLPFFLAELAIFWGLDKGKVFSRWSSVVVLSIACLSLISWLLLRQDGLVDSYRALKGTEILGSITFYILLVSPFAFLIWFLGFGEKARDFFNWKPSLPVTEPPLPPTFD